MIFFPDAKTFNFYFKFLKQLFLAFIWVARFVINNVKIKPNNCFFISKKWKLMKNSKKMGTFDFLNPRFTCLYHKNSSKWIVWLSKQQHTRFFSDIKTGEFSKIMDELKWYFWYTTNLSDQRSIWNQFWVVSWILKPQKSKRNEMSKSKNLIEIGTFNICHETLRGCAGAVWNCCV